jgi:hypothetical protein
VLEMVMTGSWGDAGRVRGSQVSGPGSVLWWRLAAVEWWWLGAGFCAGGGRPLCGLLGGLRSGASVEAGAAPAAWWALSMVLVGMRKPGRRPRVLVVLADINFRRLQMGGGGRSGASRPDLVVVGAGSHGPCGWCWGSSSMQPTRSPVVGQLPGKRMLGRCVATVFVA